jgi:hypothetical protein
MTGISRTRRHLIPRACLLLLGAVLTLGTLVAPSPAQAKAARATTPPAGSPVPGGPPLAGTIQSASARSLTLKLASTDKAVTIHLTSSTRYMVNGAPTTTAPQWKKGEKVQVFGTKHKNGSYTAQAIVVGTPPSGPPPGGPPPGNGPPGSVTPLDGTVVSLSSFSLVVKDAKGTKKTLHLTSGTRYFVNGKPTSTRPPLKSGTKVHVFVSTSGKSLSAQLVIVGAVPALLQGPPQIPPFGQQP